jgi:hypothetical protein
LSLADKLLEVAIAVRPGQGPARHREEAGDGRAARLGKSVASAGVIRALERASSASCRRRKR